MSGRVWVGFVGIAGIVVVTAAGVAAIVALPMPWFSGALAVLCQAIIYRVTVYAMERP